MNDFRKAIESQKITGKDLVRIDANDLLTMGINNFGDRKDLEKYLKQLQNKSNNEGNKETSGYHYE